MKRTLYHSLCIRDNTRYKFEKWQKYLEQLWGRRVTQDEVVEYLIDNAGVPGDDNE
jgi:Txe/YoeB family toxin of Txe-Axe toxin-antitoxin module